MSLALDQITVPQHIYHVKTGHTLCANEKFILFQDGPTTIEFCRPPKFEMKKIPWRNGLLRDITWCEELGLFVLLTQKALFAFNVNTLSTSSGSGDGQFTMISFPKVVPFEDEKAFWRCACAGSTLFIIYSGFGSVIDEYQLTSSTCKFINRWTPPKTCASHEGIWSIRGHPETDQLGLSVMDGRTNQWRLELRQPKTMTRLSQLALPLGNGDCEVSPLSHGNWLIINSCGIRLIHISNQQFKTAVEYERELKNAITFNEEYFIVRTKSTVDIHLMKKKEK